METHLPAENHACSQLPGGLTHSLTYCLVLIRPKHECIRNPLVLYSVCIKCFGTASPLNRWSLVMQLCICRGSTITVIARRTGEHWVWFGQTRILAWNQHLVIDSVVPVIHPPPKNVNCTSHFGLIQTDHNLWKDTSELLSPKYQTLSWYTISRITHIVLNPAILSESSAKNSHRSIWLNWSLGFSMPSILDLGEGSGCFTELPFPKIQGCGSYHTPEPVWWQFSYIHHEGKGRVEQAPPVEFTVWHVCTEQYSPNSSLVEKESQVDLPFLCCFLPGLQQLYWLSLSLSSGLLFEYSQKCVDSPGLIPAALWRHSWVSIKAGALTVTLVWPSLALAPLEARLPTTFSRASHEPQSNRRFQKWRHSTGT